MYWTSTGRRKAILADSQERVENAESEVASVARLLAEIEADTEQASRLAAGEGRLEEVAAEAESVRDEHQQQVQAAEVVEDELSERQAELDQAKVEVNRALGDLQIRADRIDEEAQLSGRATALTAEAEQAAPALAAALRHHQEAEASHGTARERFEQTRRASAQADRDREHLRQIIETRQLGARHERVMTAQEQLDNANAIIEAIRIDDDDIPRDRGCSASRHRGTGRSAGGIGDGYDHRIEWS